jgi:hypothetical protein
MDLSMPQLIQQPESFRERYLAVVVFQVDVLGDPSHSGLAGANSQHRWVLRTLGLDERHTQIGLWDVESFPREGQTSRIEVKVGHGAKTVKMERPFTSGMAQGASPVPRDR